LEAALRLLNQTGILLLLGSILGMLSATMTVASEESNRSFGQKGRIAMQQAATAQPGNIPSLDALEPARVETFTFGLG
jgi:hypothetical protein